MTSQQHADALLQQWQSLRALPPESRIEALFFDCFRKVAPCSVEYEAILRNVAWEMAA